MNRNKAPRRNRRAAGKQNDQPGNRARGKTPRGKSLAQMLHVNRSTVRAALGKLESMDLVEICHGEGCL
ncbi:MAG: GntR family transcriptional regulator [Desulfobacterales bacterium]